MLYGIFSDVHSNLEALEAVLAALRQEKPDRLLCAGDLVGYGADPASCVKRLQENQVTAVCGNHDCAAVGQMPHDWFNEHARAAVVWTAEHLPPLSRTYLKQLSYTWKDSAVTLAHGSVAKPELFSYVFDLEGAAASLSAQETPVAFIGHTHVPGFFLHAPEQPVHYEKKSSHKLEAGEKALVNVGSVGQPRDGDPRAAYCLYNSETKELTIKRVEYPVEQAQAKIRAAGLPEFLAHRLELGC